MVTYRQIFALAEFRAVFATFAVSVGAMTVKMLALSAFVYARTGSPLLSAVAFLVGFLPQAIGALTLMSLADRLPPRAALAWWRAAQAVLLGVLALGVLPVWAVLVLVVAGGLGDAVAGAISNAVLVDILDIGDGAYVLGRSVLNVSVGVMQILGYAAGGVLIATTGPRGAFAIAAGAGVVTALLTWGGLRRREPRATGRASPAATWQGNRRLFREPRLRVLLLAQWLPNGLIVGAEVMFVPYAGDAAGVLFTAAAAGMLTGDLVVGRWVTPAVRARLGLPLYVLLAVPYLAFALRPGPMVAAGLVAVASIGYAATLTLQERFLAAVPRDLVGQGLGVAQSGMLTAQAVAATVIGSLAELATPAAAIVIAAVVSLGATLTVCRSQPSRPADGEPSMSPTAR
ncbi:MFS transporter [Actinoplanes sp. NPDC051494]|uniref:MFS transporter n=1 Tax=Actinoplanes sp. NPDC051494 TaxID=3363907 RepID=UPI0037ACA324